MNNAESNISAILIVVGFVFLVVAGMGGLDFFLFGDRRIKSLESEVVRLELRIKNIAVKQCTCNTNQTHAPQN